MASTIQIKRGTGSAVPTGLADGELAINLDNNRLYFGSGSAVKNSFRVAELIADTATITQVTSSIVSSSVLFSSGSNIFGDALSDTHTFNGNITASNHIKVIGTSSLPFVTSPDALGTKFGDGAQIFDSFIVYPNSLFIGNITSSANIKCDDINADNFILNYGGQIKIFDSGNNLETAILNVADALVVFGDADSAVTTLAGTDVTIDAGDDITIDSATHKVKVLGHITASKNISSSGHVIASRIYGNADGAFITTANGQIQSSTGFTGTNITASGNISASGNIIGNVGQFSQIQIDGEVALDTGDSATTGRVFLDSQITKIQIGKGGSATQTVIEGHITASGNISGSVTSTGSFGRVEASGVIKAEHIESTDDMTVAGDLDVTGEIECDHLNIADVDDGIHFGDTQVLFVDASNNVNFGVDGNAAVDLELYGHDHTYTAGGNITLDATGNITLDAASNYVRFKDSGTTTLTIDTSAGHITASGNISASAGSILSVPLRHLDQTVQNITSSRAQGDIFYAESNVSTVPGKIYSMLGNGNQTPADKDTELYASSLLGVALGTNSGTDGYLLRGMVKLHTNPFPGEAAIGNPAYLGDDGLATGSIAGHASDDFIRIIGYGISGSGTIYFDPDKTFIKKS